jgi:LPS O-antigen subunit length determinant protein (WzzB/FepE family)
MSIEWKNPLTAANWANTLVERLNERMRSRALTEAELNVGYLKEELASANAVSLQQSISHVLESELQKLMLAKATKEYSFKILDHAVPSKRPAWPRPFLIISIAAFVGVTTSCLFLLLQYSLRSSGTT